MLLHKLKKTIEEVQNILKNKSLMTYKKLQSFIDLIFFIVKVIFLGQTFFEHLYNISAKKQKYLH